MTVVKRSKKHSAAELQQALDKFVEALKGQDEAEAVAELESIKADLANVEPGTDAFAKVVAAISEAFEEHELGAYTFKPKTEEGSWGPADVLYVTSTQVLSLLKRF